MLSLYVEAKSTFDRTDDETFVVLCFLRGDVFFSLHILQSWRKKLFIKYDDHFIAARSAFLSSFSSLHDDKTIQRKSFL